MLEEKVKRYFIGKTFEIPKGWTNDYYVAVTDIKFTVNDLFLRDNRTYGGYKAIFLVSCEGRCLPLPQYQHSTDMDSPNYKDNTICTYEFAPVKYNLLRRLKYFGVDGIECYTPHTEEYFRESKEEHEADLRYELAQHKKKKKISLKESFQQLLLEQEAKAMLIRTAIQNKWVVNIDYRGDGTINAGKRDVEPVCLGVTKAGNLAVRAWQVKGVSDTPENMPGWRLFLIDKITMIKTNRVAFTRPRPNFNKNGDKTLVKVLLLAKF